MTDIEVDDFRLRSRNPGVQLDFGAVGKGYGIDLAVRHLRDLGVKNAIVNAGGDLRATGDHGDRPWRVAVRKPGGGSIGYIEVQGDEAIFTSGNYERFRQEETRRYPHILDPRSGWPIRHRLASVSVFHPRCMVADALATALMVMGAEEGYQLALAENLPVLFLVRDGDGFVERGTPAFWELAGEE